MEYPSTRHHDLIVSSESELKTFIQDWVQQLKPGQVIFLQGDLGAGKTTWVRYVLRALGYQDKVKSPTYTLVESYPLPSSTVHHFDLYRIQDPEELFFIGWEEYFGDHSLVFIEWPEMAKGALPKADWLIQLALVENEPEKRRVVIFR